MGGIINIMKKLQYLFMVAICASLAGCADKQVEDDIEIVDEVFKDGNIYEADDEVLDDEIQNDEMAFSYENLGGIEFCFSSGAGAWSTIMTIGEDGSFKGMYSDSDMGDVGDAYPDGTRYCCNFKGQLSELTKIDERTYTAELIDISYENAVGEEEYADNVRYIYSDAYGLDDAETLYFYLPGTPKENLSEECLSWISQMMYDEDYNPIDELDFVCLYNSKGEQAFYSYNVVDNFLAFFSYYEYEEQSYLDELQNLTTQMDMTENAYNRFKLWDNVLNEEWTILMSILPEDEKEQLREAEREWIAYKDNAVKEAGAPAEGGSIQSMLEYDMGAEITKARVYELKEMLLLQ